MAKVKVKTRVERTKRYTENHSQLPRRASLSIARIEISAAENATTLPIKTGTNPIAGATKPQPISS